MEVKFLYFYIIKSFICIMVIEKELFLYLILLLYLNLFFCEIFFNILNKGLFVIVFCFLVLIF